MPLGDVGRGLGQAIGSIRIDTSGAESAANRMRSIGRNIADSIKPASDGVSTFIARTQQIGTNTAGIDVFIRKMREAGVQVKTTRLSLSDIGKGINVVRGELIALGAGAAILGKIGLSGAKSIRNYRTSFANLLGDEKQAVALMGQLTDSANDFGIEVEEVWQLARALLPTLRGNTAELNTFVKRAALLASTNPLKSTADAARAIQEFLAGQTISLQRLFNVDPNIIEEAKNQFKDVGSQLDFILNRLGATEEGARAMADATVGVKNELKLLLAEGFTPLFQALQPILTRFREFIQNLRETSPQVLTIGASFVTATAAITPMVLVLGRVLEVAQKLKALNLAANLGGIGPALVKAGLLGGAAVVGANIGLQVGKGIGRATGNEQIANTTFQDVATTFKRIVFIVASAISSLSAKIVTGVSRAVAAFIGGISNILSAMAKFAEGIADFLGPVLGENMKRNVVALEVFADALGRGQQALDNFANNVGERQQENLRKFGDFLGVTDFGGLGAGAAGLGTSGVGGASAGPDLSAFDEQIEQATADYKERVADIESRANDQRLQATRQYEQQRSSIIADYNLQRAREAEDFARQRARQEEEFNRQLSDILEERTEREREWADDLNERIADIRSEGADRIAQIEEEAARNRERAERDHRFRLFDAARRLDATAVANELRTFSTQQSDASIDLARRLEQERANIEQRIQQEQQGHQQRLEQAKAADDQRIADMVEQFERQKELEDEDRAIALKRSAEDHKAQLAELARSHQEQLKEIQTSKQKELATLQVEHQKQLAEIQKEKAAELAEYQEANGKQLDAVKTGNEAKLLEQEAGQERSLDSHRQYWDEVNKIASEAIANVKGDPSVKKPKGTIIVQGTPASYQHGGPVPNTGLAFLHSGEHVLNPTTTAAVQGMLGNGFTQGQLLSALASGGRNGGASIQISPGAIQVIAAPGMDAAAVGRAVRGELASLFRSMTAV